MWKITNFIKNLIKQQTFDITKTSRGLFAQILENYTLEQLNKIPVGFNNNMIWNIGHIVSTQQTLVYKLSGIETLVSDEFIAKYRKGTKPEGDVLQAEVDAIKALLFETIKKTEQDYNNKIFKTYTEITTSLGFVLKNVEEALNFNNFHEAAHLGIIMSIRKFV